MAFVPDSRNVPLPLGQPYPDAWDNPDLEAINNLYRATPTDPAYNPQVAQANLPAPVYAGIQAYWGGTPTAPAAPLPLGSSAATASAAGTAALRPVTGAFSAFAQPATASKANASWDLLRRWRELLPRESGPRDVMSLFGISGVDGPAVPVNQQVMGPGFRPPPDRPAETRLFESRQRLEMAQSQANWPAYLEAELRRQGFRRNEAGEWIPPPGYNLSPADFEAGIDRIWQRFVAEASQALAPLEEEYRQAAREAESEASQRYWDEQRAKARQAQLQRQQEADLRQRQRELEQRYGGGPLAFIGDLPRAVWDAPLALLAGPLGPAQAQLPGVRDLTLGRVLGADIPEPVRAPLKEAATLAIRSQPGLGPVTEVVRRAGGPDIARAAAELIVPREVWEVALEFIPYIGVVPDMTRLARAVGPELAQTLARSTPDAARALLREGTARVAASPVERVLPAGLLAEERAGAAVARATGREPLEGARLRAGVRGAADETTGKVSKAQAARISKALQSPAAPADVPALSPTGQLSSATPAPEAPVRPRRAAAKAAAAEAAAPPSAPAPPPARDPILAADPGPPPRQAPAKAAQPAGGPGGPRKPRGSKAMPEPDDVFARISARAVRGEKVEETLMRLHEGAIQTARNEAQAIVDDANERLFKSGIGIKRAGTVVPRESDIPELDALFEALHNASKVRAGRVKVPERLRDHFDALRQLVDWEEAARIDFDPEIATVRDYFYRGWKPPEEMLRVQQGGHLGAKPAFLKPRVNATYREMRDLGFEPLHWNPYEQWKVARIQGIHYREQMRLIDDIRQLELARPYDGGPIPEGWRTPRVGPAFEGKPFALVDETGQARTMWTRRWVVPDSLADRLENIYGIKPSLGKVGKVDILQAIDAVVFTTKRAKLFGSLFQHKDFLTRSGVGAFQGFVNGLRHGDVAGASASLWRWPATAAKIMRAAVSPQYRRVLRKEALSTKPILAGRPGLHMRAISEAGLSIQDVTVLPPDLDKVAQAVAEEHGLMKIKAVQRALNEIEAVSRRSLFQGVYPAAILTDLQNNIVPSLARILPAASDAELASLAARIANTKYSTLPASQSVIQLRWVRETLRRGLFSVNEAESLLRQGTGALRRGPEGEYWREHWIGAFLFLSTVANTIHFVTTGEVLPFDRYSPIARDKWGPLPFGYNRNFAAPEIPVKGRGGTKLTLDVVDQLDTVFRILDPAGFLFARESVPLRAVHNQLMGTDFFGEPIDRVGPGGIFSRTAQLIMDMFAPIGFGQAAIEITRQKIAAAEDWLPAAEARLGTAGSLIQGTGLNLRAETNQELRDRMARESGIMRDGRPVTRWDELLPAEKEELLDRQENRAYAEELRRRQAEAATRGSILAQVQIINEERRAQFEDAARAVDQRLSAGELGGRDARLEYDRLDRIRALEAQMRMESPEVQRELNALERRRDALTTEQQATLDYYEIFKRPDVVDPLTRELNYEAYQAALQAWEEKYPQFSREEVSPSRPLSPQHAELKAARKELQPYFDAPDAAYRAARLKAETASPDSLARLVLQYETLDEFRDAVTTTLRKAGVPETQIQARRQAVEDAIGLTELIQTARKIVIQNNPALVLPLEKWYGAPLYIREAAAAAVQAGAR